MLAHPGPASVPCSLCQQFVFEADRQGKLTGKQKFLANGEPCLRPANVSPPCKTCPKESPEKEAEHVLSPKNLATFRLYWQVRATHGRCLSEREAADPVLRQNLAIVDVVVKASERDSAAQAVAAELSPLLLR